MKERRLLASLKPGDPWREVDRANPATGALGLSPQRPEQPTAGLLGLSSSARRFSRCPACICGAPLQVRILGRCVFLSLLCYCTRQPPEHTPHTERHTRTYQRYASLLNRGAPTCWSGGRSAVPTVFAGYAFARQWPTAVTARERQSECRWWGVVVTLQDNRG